MWVIAGLGNPGIRYAKTRHNTGFLVIEEIARRAGLKFKTEGDLRISRGVIEGTDLVLIEPLTFMNLSGIAIKRILRQFNISSDNLIIIHDDVDMETGKLRIRKRGSSGGHRGIESIISSIGSREFIRVKVGIGKEKGVPVEEYVLGKFKKEEMPLILDAVNRAADAVLCIISEGVDKAMNKFNRS